MSNEEQIEKLKFMIGQLVNANAALMSAGEKMALILTQKNVKRHVLEEWNSVVAQIRCK